MSFYFFLQSNFVRRKKENQNSTLFCF